MLLLLQLSTFWGCLNVMVSVFTVLRTCQLLMRWLQIWLFLQQTVIHTNLKQDKL